MFSQGYPFHDEHWDVIRVAQDWVNGIPQWIENETPPNHSMFYAGINALFLFLLESVGVYDPNLKMTFIKVIHAIYSLLIVSYGYKTTEQLSSKREAIIVGLILSIVWFLPFLSTQNLVEITCIPPVLAAFYLISKSNATYRDWLIAGVLLGLAFTLRLHVVIFAGGIGIVMLYKKQFKEAIIFSLGFVLMSFLITGLIDLYFWSYPFQSIVSYFAFNTDHAYSFSTGPVYRFVLTVVGIMVPPISIMLCAGYIKSWNVCKYMWLAGTLFFIVHSLFPNKQERFILPFIPLFIILGVIGWYQIAENKQFFFKKWHIASWSFFWVINFLVAVTLSLSYMKKDRVEPLVYISQFKDVRAVIIESAAGIKPVPEFYLGGISIVSDEADRYFRVSHIKPTQIKIIYLKPEMKSLPSLSKEIEARGTEPNYIVFKGKDMLEMRKSKFVQMYPGYELEPLTVIKPSVLDQVLHFLNPRVHKEKDSYIYRLTSSKTTYAL